MNLCSSGLDTAGGGVPGDGGAAEVGFVGHVAGEGGVVAEDHVFDDRLSGANVLEEIPEVRADIVVGITLVGVGFDERFLTGSNVVLGVPLLEVFGAHGRSIARGVVAGIFVLAGLGRKGEPGSGDFERAFGNLEAVKLR